MPPRGDVTLEKPRRRQFLGRIAGARWREATEPLPDTLRRWFGEAPSLPFPHARETASQAYPVLNLPITHTPPQMPGRGRRRCSGGPWRARAARVRSPRRSRSSTSVRCSSPASPRCANTASAILKTAAPRGNGARKHRRPSPPERPRRAGHFDEPSGVVASTQRKPRLLPLSQPLGRIQLQQPHRRSVQ